MLRPNLRTALRSIIIFTSIAICSTGVMSASAGAVPSPGELRSDAVPPARALYREVLSLVVPTNGFNVVEVYHPGGRFVQGNGGRWTEMGNDGARFNFVETGRDEWSVYLNDPGRNLQIQLDLFRRLILWGQNGGPKSPLYQITDAAGGQGQIGEAISQSVVNYNCNEGIPMQVIYTNQGNRSTANVIHDGFQLGEMQQVQSGSGVAYSNGRYLLMSKGRQAVLQWDGITDVCFEQ